LQTWETQVYPSQSSFVRQSKGTNNTDQTGSQTKKSSSSSTKSKARGLSQKERDLLEYLKDDPSMKQIVLQKILDKQANSDDDTVSSASSSAPPKPEDFQDSQDPYEL